MDLDEYQTDTIGDGSQDWMSYRKASEDDNYGSQDTEMIRGWHGEYDLAQGYFDCFNKETFPTREEFTTHMTDLRNSDYIDSGTRAIVVSFTMYDLPSHFYTDINIIIEISAAGFYNPSILEVRPFKIPLKDPSVNPLGILLIRGGLCLGWIILVLITMMKKGSVEQLITWQTFQDTSISLFVLILQFYSLFMIAQTQVYHPDPGDLQNEEIKDKFQMFRYTARTQSDILYADTLSIIGMFTNLLTMMRIFNWIDFFLGSVRESIKTTFFFLVIFGTTLLGMAICNITLYGYTSLKYCKPANAILHTLYSPIYTTHQGEERFSVAEAGFKLINMLIYYVQVTFLLFAVFIAIMHDAYRNIAIAKGDPLAPSKVGGFKASFWQFVRWFFDWLPDNMVRKIGQFENLAENDLHDIEDEINRKLP